MCNEDKEIEIAYKKAITDFLEGVPGTTRWEEGSIILQKIAAELAKFNRNFPTLIQEMASLRGSIDKARGLRP
uniref:Uncharacterized protein n=1 Tax=viral metagenome TaxID=1070528 RepID=A0A6M3X8Y5_9ZZZZ